MTPQDLSFSQVRDRTELTLKAGGAGGREGGRNGEGVGRKGEGERGGRREKERAMENKGREKGEKGRVEERKGEGEGGGRRRKTRLYPPPSL